MKRLPRAGSKPRINHMTNAAIYARFSTDRQRETSLADQAEVCRAHGALLGLAIAAVYTDDGVSGSTPVGARVGGARMLADVLAGRVEVLLLEGLDRLSRDQVEQERTVRRLEHRGIRIVGVADGYDSEAAGRKIHRTMRGLINEIYLDDLRHKTHRGLAGQLARGGHAGGLAFGYRSVADGDVHRLEVVPEQAEVVRWIFERYVEGWSPQRLASDLNARGVKTGRGGTWAVSALYGSPAKGSGVLNNELYIGRTIWNRSQWVKDPDTGKRTRIDRPREEWVVLERPELRIVSDEAWQAVRDRMGRPSSEGGSAGKGGRARSLLGGLIRCGHCGGAVVATSARHYGCAARKDRGPAVCSGVQASRQRVDASVMQAIREDLLSPEAIAEMQATVREILADRRREARASETAARARVQALDAEIGRLVDAIAQVGVSPALKERLQRAEAERAQAAAPPSSTDPVSASLIDGLQRYRKLIADLDDTLASDVPRAREILRDMIAPAVMLEHDGQVWVEMETGQAAIAVGLSLGAVAGARFGTKRRLLVR